MPRAHSHLAGLGWCASWRSGWWVRDIGGPCPGNRCEPERVDHVGRCQSPGGIECQGLCRRLNAARAVGQEDVSREHHAVFAIESDAAPGMAWNVHDAKARDRVAILEQDVCVDGLALGASAVDCATCLLLTPWPSAGCAGLQRNPQRQACV